MNRTEALRIVATFAAAHPAWKATEATVELWVDLLGDLPYTPTSAAARHLIATVDGWPSIATLRTTVARQAGLLPPDVDVACRQFLTAARGNGGTPHPAVDDVASALGGWSQIRRADNVSVLLGQFRQLYAAAAQRTTADVVGSDSLTGLPAPDTVLALQAGAA